MRLAPLAATDLNVVQLVGHLLGSSLAEEFDPTLGEVTSHLVATFSFLFKI